jgi:hypothetical protein
VLADALMRPLALALAVLASACGSRLPSPAYVGQPSSALVRVGSPPPPARVEFVPARPRAGAVWTDGEWLWQGRGWSWQSGRWVEPPAGCAFSPWTTTWGDDGSVYYAPGVWRDAEGHPVAAPASLATAKPGAGPVLDPAGEQETTGEIHQDTAP